MQLDKLGDTIDEVLAKTGTRKLTASQRIVILGCVGGFIPAQPAGVSEVEDACENLLHRLEGWGKAYPERSFPEATPEQLQWLHETRPGLCDRISAGMGRHIARMIQSDITELRAAILAARAAVKP